MMPTGYRPAEARFPQLVGPPKEDICYATQNRQEAVHSLAAEADLVLVLGSQNSSNSLRLKEIALEIGVPAQLIDGARDIDDHWFDDVETVVITAGASAPESVVAECVAYLQTRYDARIESRVLRKEDVHFPLPRELRTIGA
jgi:4-hydroxy-3-methylbut-2-enyl diphosphate reductase